jgi:uncharacterized protein
MRTWYVTCAGVLVLSLVLAACGGDAAVEQTATTEAVAPATPATQVASAAPDSTTAPAGITAETTPAASVSTIAPESDATEATTSAPEAPSEIATATEEAATIAPVGTTVAEATAEPAAVAVAPAETVTAAPDPWAQYAQYTIEGLRARTYGEGEIEIVQTLEETANFTRYLVAYPSDGLRLTAMLNRPRGDGPFPVVILNHGYYPLDVYQTGNGTKLAADYLADRGYMTFSPDFRSHAGSDDAPNLFRAGHVIDTLNLIPLAQRFPAAQAGKVGMWGHSNGGAITAKAIVVSDQIGAALIYAPASSNIVEDYQFRVERAAFRGTTIDRVEWPVLPEEGPDLYERLSPLPSLRYVTAPVQLHWGTADEIVPRKWPEDVYTGLQAAGKDVAWFEYAGEPHSFTAAGNSVYLPRMVEFFDQHIRAQ